MRFTLEVLKAKKGDCLLLHYGSAKSPRLVVIDGGPSSVYANHLSPRLQALRASRKLKRDASLPIDVMMVSHVDDDHIVGILDMCRELRDAKTDRQPLPYRVKELWHNSFDKLLRTTPEQLKGEASAGAAALVSLQSEAEGGADLELDIAQVLASIPQGARLRDDAKFLGIPLNAKFKEELVMATEKPRVVKLEGGPRLTVVGPMQPELIALQKKHDEWLRNKKNAGAEASLAAFVDKSVPNLSSLVFLVEQEGKRMLLTGDARGDKVLEGLEFAGLVEEGGQLEVDVFKVPHHGSSNNAAPELFERVIADHYVFSGDGQHGNPERETLEMLLEARGSQAFSLYFTYPIEDIDRERKAEWEKQRKRASKKKPKRAWSAKQDSLERFLSKANISNRKQKVFIVPEDTGHCIDLLDPFAG